MPTARRLQSSSEAFSGGPRLHERELASSHSGGVGTIALRRTGPVAPRMVISPGGRRLEIGHLIRSQI